MPIPDDIKADRHLSILNAAESGMGFTSSFHLNVPTHHTKPVPLVYDTPPYGLFTLILVVTNNYGVSHICMNTLPGQTMFS